jgi:hypothetical protein
MRYGSLVLVMGLILTLPPAAQAASTAMAMGKGVSTCAKFAQDYQRDVGIEDVYFVWAQGFMAGINATANVAHLPTKDLNGSSTLDQRQNIREYCATNPLKMYMEAVDAAMNALPTVQYKP